MNWKHRSFSPFLTTIIFAAAISPAHAQWETRGDDVYYLGEVGIGTNRPRAGLEIRSETGTNLIVSHPDTGAAGINLRNANGYWHISGPRSYESGNPLSIFWNDGSWRRRLTLMDDGKLGIGTDRPNQELHVKSSGHTDVTIEAPTNYNAGLLLYEGANLRWLVYNDGDEGDRFRISNGTQDHLTIERNGNVGIGVNPSNKLEVAGTIRAEEIIVETGWADHVFDDDYPLMPLDEVAHYIGLQGHLPGIPTADEVADHGVKLGEMQVSLLKKIEEMTMHLIAQDKEIRRLRDRIDQLEGAVR